MKIELGKDHEYQTRDGRQVRIHAVDIAGGYPVLYSVLSSGQWVIRTANSEGYALASDRMTDADIIAKPVVREFWVNVYPGSHSSLVHNSRASANANADKTQMAVMRIRYRDIDIKDGVIELQSWKDS